MCVRKWSHPVLEEEDFKAEWDAIESAVALRGDVCHDDPDAWYRSGTLVAPPIVPVKPRLTTARVHFASHVPNCWEGR